MKTIIKRVLAAFSAFSLCLGANAATSSGLVHRWSFNGSLEDTVGGATAVTNGACSFTEDGKGVTLAGGSKGTSFVTLGACPNLLPSKSMTLEIWATQDAVQNWSRIFDFGSDQNNYLTASWTREANLGQDCVEIISSYYNLISVKDTMQPYAIGKKWHISLTVSCNADGTSTLRWAKRDAATGALAASGSAVTSRAWTPASLASGSCYLGHSQYNDNDASATYDEVRIWNRVLSDAELDANAAAGPDGLFGDIMPTPAVAELPPSTDYVQDGLLAHWDAIDNSIVDGVRVHDDNAATWKDLTGNGHDFPIAEYIGSQLIGWTATSLDAKSCYDIPAAVACTNYVTLEICARHNAANAIFFNSGDGGNKFAAFYNGYLQFYNRGAYNVIGSQARTFQATAVHSPTVSAPVVYTNAVEVASTSYDSWSLSTPTNTTLGSGRDYYGFGGEYYAIRLYDRALTADEIAQNARLDALRYLGDRSAALSDDSLEVAGSPIAVGAATPAYGISLGHGAGDTLACSVPATVTVGETRASCTGYTVTTNGAAYAQGDTASFTLQHPGVATRVEWQWSAEYKVAATALEGGSVSIAKQWFASGETATITATPDEGYVFVAWLGVVPEAKRRDAALELEVASPVAVTAVFAPADVFTGDVVFYNGETEPGVYAIVAPEQLDLFRASTIAGTTYEGSTFHILADIDLDGRIWSPCGTFSGVLDGHGHAIRNINISNNSNTGLFSILNGATVRNLSLRGGKMVMNANNCIGGITGRVQGQGCVIEDCTVDLEILSRSTSDETWVGGIVGVVEAELTLSRCRSLCAVTADDNYAYSRIGGLVGNAKVGLTIEGCYASGSLQGSCFAYGNSYAGGILGYRQGGTVVISNSYWTAENRFNFNADTHTVGYGESYCTIVDTPAILDNFPKNTFNVRTRGNGTGTAAYVNGEFVATPDEGSVFIRWEGLPPEDGDYNETTVWAVFGETVSSYDEFMAMNRAGFYVQTEDIDMSGVANFEGHSNYRHYGYYDGGNHEIRNMSCPNGRGMFGALICAEIKNLRIVNPLVGTNCYGNKGILAQYAESSRISNVHVEGGSVLGRDNNPAGGLVAEGNCGIIEDCSSSAAVGSEVTGWGPGTGGLVGKVCNGMTLRRCRAAGDVTGAGYNIGGLAGRADSGLIEECLSSATVEGPEIIGGLIGAGGSATVRRCCATGAVTGGGLVGGFIGNGDFMSFTDCCALGAVTATNSDYYAGGFVAGDGAWNANLAFTNCYSAGAVSGETNSGGFDSASRSTQRSSTGCYWDTKASGKDSTYVTGATGLTTAEMQSGVAFDGWDTTVWKFTAGMYPRLRAFIPKYAVTWLDDDGETVLKEELVDEFDLPACDTPEKAATPKYTYTFAGWDPEVVAVTGEATYTATYDATINKYTITWKNDDGTTLDSESVEYDATPAHADPVKAATPKFTYTFAGWNPEVATVTGEATYTAKYDATINEYTITWKNDDGTVIDSADVAYDETPTHADPTKASTAQYHYEFAGWNPEVATVTGEAAYTATFTPVLRSYTITWLNEDGTAFDTSTVEYGMTPSHAAPTKASTAQYDYTFAGWGNVVAVSGEATYQATFTPVLRSYTVSWVVEGETVASGLVAYGTTPAYGGVTPTKAETAEYTYTFSGWSPSVASVTGPVTYTAQFNSTKRSYTITWANIDGAGASATSTVEYGTTPTYSGDTPTKTETAEYTYTFSGWSPSVASVTGPATYTAQFNATKRSYTITWANIDGAGASATSTVEYGTVPAYSGATPVKASTAEYSYEFTGWSPAIASVSGEATYTAEFEATKRSYTITWANIDGAGASATSTVEYGTTPTYSGDTPTKTETAEYTYTFSGWSPAIASVSGEATYTAQFEVTKRSYTITWANIDGAGASATSTVEYGTTPVYDGETPTKAETAEYTYEFTGWSPTVATVTGPATYTAQFNATPKEPEDEFAGYVKISDVEDFNAIANNLATNYVLTADIDLQNVERQPFGEFSGILDGNGHAIRNINIKGGASNERGTGLFQALNNGAIVRNLTLENGTVESLNTTEDATGGIAGHVYNSVTIENCTVDLNVKGYQYVGGIVGYARWHGNFTISRCRSFADVAGAYRYVGGLLGNAFQMDVLVEDSYSCGMVTADDNYAGGLVGYKYQGTLAIGNCFHKSIVTPNANNDRKLVGNGDDNATITGNPTVIDALPKGGVRIVVVENGGSGTAAYVNGELVAAPGEGSALERWIGEVPSGEFNDVKVWAVFCEATYTVTWKNDDGTTLETDEDVAYGATPTYDGATPTKAETAEYTYTFADWSPAVAAVTGDTVYTATFNAIPKSESGTIDISTLAKGDVVQNGSVLTGTAPNLYLKIADGATITLDGVCITNSASNVSVLHCLGDATIILAPGSENTVVGTVGRYCDGNAIYVPTNSTLTIKGSGALYADSSSSDNKSAAIGAFAYPYNADYVFPCGNIVIEGGTITAKGGVGIGASGNGGYCGDITITGDANVTAIATVNGSAGIGSAGSNGNCGDITISGNASVTATGKYNGPGIGAADHSTCGNIVIATTGTVTATGNYFAPGIGACGAYEPCTCGNITITSGTVIATGGIHAAGIGTDYYYQRSGTCGSITIADTITMVTAQGMDDSPGIYTASPSEFTYGSHLRLVTSDENRCYTLTPVSGGQDGVVDLSTLTGNYTAQDGDVLTGATGYAITIAAGATVTLDGVDIACTSGSDPAVTCLGDATIILAESSANSIDGSATSYAGIFIYSPGSDTTNTLTIAGTGALTVLGGDKSAGIGSNAYNNSGSAGNIVISGGTVTATGGEWAAGIGSGYRGTCGDITITGGTVTANIDTTTSDRFTDTAALGAGCRGECGNILISGGTVTAISVNPQSSNFYDRSCAIGATYSNGRCGNITITDGITSVTATKGATAQQHIGQGDGDATIGTVTISPRLAQTLTNNNLTLTLTPQDVPETVTVTWKNDDGTTLETDTVAYGATPTYDGETPTKAADAQYTYEFAGWTPAVAAVTGDTVYTATFTPVTRSYTVTWVVEGVTVASGSVEYGQTPTYDGDTPTKAADAQYTYTFKGWTPAVGAATSNTTYTATFSGTLRSYTVTWVVEGETVASGAVEYGTTPTYSGDTPTKPETAEYTYTFNGWTPAIAAVTDDATYTAQFSRTKRTYTVSWVVEGMTVASSAVEYGQTPTYGGDTPAKASTAEYSYAFTGWSPAVAAVTGDATYTAQFSQTKRSYTIMWVVEGATVASGAVAYGTRPTYTGETPTKESTAEYSYAFSGWSPTISAVTGEATYTAQFEATKRSYTVSWVVEGETVASGSVEYGTTPVYNGATPTKPEDEDYTYAFTGWSPAVVAVTGNATYTATFSETPKEEPEEPGEFRILVDEYDPTTVTGFEGTCPATITAADWPESVTYISAGFDGCTTLKHLTLPAGLQSIGWRAFHNCTALETVDFSNCSSTLVEIGSWSFCGCTSLRSLVINGNDAYIGNGAFFACTSLASLQLGSGISQVDEYAFGACKSLAEVASEAAEVDETAFIGTAYYRSMPFSFIVKTDWEEKLSVAGFKGPCPATIAASDWPAGVESIYDCAFTYCDDLRSVEFPASFSRINAGTFAACRALESITFPATNEHEEGLQVGHNAFALCTNLYSVTLRGPLAVDMEAFGGCSHLETVVVEEGVNFWGDNIFARTGVRSIVLPENMNSVSAGAFAGNDGDFTVYVPRSVENNYELENGIVECEPYTPKVFGLESEERWAEYGFTYQETTTTLVVRKIGEPVAPEQPSITVDDTKMEEPVDNGDGTRTIAAKEGETLTQSDVASVTVAWPVDPAIDITAAYTKTLVDNAIVLQLAVPALEDVPEVEDDDEDPSGMLDDVDDIDDGKIAAMPEPDVSDPDPENHEKVGALPVKMYPGLYYQASWGDDLNNLTPGAKFRADGVQTHIGVIKQTGSRGFYKISVSER